MHKSLFLFSFDPNIVEPAIDLKPDSIFTGHKNLDPTQIKRFKDADIEVNVEVGIFAGDDLWEEFPDCIPVQKDGAPIEKIDWYAGVNPTHDGVRRKKIEEIEHIIQHFDIDGIWLDFIRWPSRWEEKKPILLDTGYDDETLSKFKNDTGRDNPEGETWTKWKCQQIIDFVKETHDLLRNNSRDITLGLFSVPWQEKEFDGAITKIIGQDLKKLSKYIDIFSPMTYHAMCGREVEWISQTAEYFKETTNKGVLPLIQTENKPRDIDTKEFGSSITQATKNPSEGVIIFFMNDLIKQKNKSKIASGFFS